MDGAVSSVFAAHLQRQEGAENYGSRDVGVLFGYACSVLRHRGGWWTTTLSTPESTPRPNLALFNCSNARPPPSAIKGERAGCWCM